MTYSLTCFISDDNITQMFKIQTKTKLDEARSSHNVLFGVLVFIYIHWDWISPTRLQIRLCCARSLPNRRPKQCYSFDQFPLF